MFKGILIEKDEAGYRAALTAKGVSFGYRRCQNSMLAASIVLHCC